MNRQQRSRWALGVLATLIVAIAVGVVAQRRGELPPPADSGEGPQYGGTLVFLTERSREKPPGWDVEEAASPSAMLYVNPYEEYLLGVDVLRNGPRGTNAFPFSMSDEEVPEEYLTGVLAESWELTTNPLGVTFHLRKGVMWTGNPNIAMKPREFTAEDAAFVLNRYREGKQASKISQFTDVGAFRAVDRYTLRAEFTRFNASWAWIIGYALYSPMYPPEVVKAEARDWRNAVGTGPFVLKNYVQGSYVSYERNPNWWGREQTVGNEKHRTPFIDELVFPIVSSVTTQLAAIRTGQVDLATAVASNYEETLRESSLNVQKSPSGKALNMVFNSTKGPASDLAFRRAVMIGISEQAIIDAVMPGGTIGGYPFSRHLGSNVFTPIDEMPADIALLYGHDAAKAKRMILDGGYAGVEFPIYYSNADGRSAQAGALIADQLSKIGIRPVLMPVEPALTAKYENSDASWEGVLVWLASNSKIGRGVDNLRGIPNTSFYFDRGHKERMDRFMAMTDGVARDAALKTEAVYMIGQSSRIAIGEEPVLTVWWPWVKNYHGEVEAG